MLSFSEAWREWVSLPCEAHEMSEEGGECPDYSLVCPPCVAYNEAWRERVSLPCEAHEVSEEGDEGLKIFTLLPAFD